MNPIKSLTNKEISSIVTMNNENSKLWEGATIHTILSRFCFGRVSFRCVFYGFESYCSSVLNRKNSSNFFP